MSIVDFCVIGFPKCGTTATIRMLKESPALKVHFRNGKPEAPFFIDAGAERPEAEPGIVNGHKFSAYVYNRAALSAILAEKPDALLLINVRPAGEALLSWRDMHREIATRNTAVHFTTQTEETRAFYMNCTEVEYYHAYAKARLDYAQRIRQLLETWPRANLVIVTQQRLSSDARGVMINLHDRLGVTAAASFLDALPKGYKPKGSRDVDDRITDPEVAAELRELDWDLLALVDQLDPSRVLCSEPCGF
jgi:hypothetical protein